MSAGKRLSVVFGLSVVTGLTVAANPGAPAFLLAPSVDRQSYLAHAVIWHDPGALTPDDIRAGRQEYVPEAIARLAPGQPLECRYESPGLQLGGKTPKFTCRAGNGESLRFKYYDGPQHGNREVFAELAATRLAWALGFDVDPMFFVAVTCLDCPANPWTGEGGRAIRRYPAAFEPHYVGTLITSNKDPDQGWTFGELDKAISALPPSALRIQQRTEFDALSLLAVFLQHGDRKRSQQRLVCRGGLDLAEGDLSAIAIRHSEIPVLMEHEGARACTGDSFVTLQDLGATFGGAGMVTGHVSAKIHLKSWADKRVFESGANGSHGANECRGDISVSGSAGSGAEENPRISEAGRQFLLAQFSRLSPEHVRAVFEAAHVDLLGDEHAEWRDKASGRTYTGIEAWTAVFLDKVAQIEHQHCAS
jgi:hypothetical protein